MPQARLSESPVPPHWSSLFGFVVDGVVVDGRVRWEGECLNGHLNPSHSLSPTFDLRQFIASSMVSLEVMFNDDVDLAPPRPFFGCSPFCIPIYLQDEGQRV